MQSTTTPALDAQRRAVERITERLMRDPETGCLEWPGARLVSGYGVTTLEGKRRTIHRIILADATGLYVGDVSPKTEARHDCDNPPCCNPEHLRWGTHGDNVRDMYKRGRAVNPRAEEFRSRTHCLRGHRMTGHNLVPCRLRFGWRECLVCNRAAKVVSDARKKGQTVSLADAVVDQLRRTDKGRDLVARDALS